jgi:hypothetical protein
MSLLKIILMCQRVPFKVEPPIKQGFPEFDIEDVKEILHREERSAKESFPLCGTPRDKEPRDFFSITRMGIGVHLTNHEAIHRLRPEKACGERFFEL